jgi:hypothetical protein
MPEQPRWIEQQPSAEEPRHLGRGIRAHRLLSGRLSEKNYGREHRRLTYKFQGRHYRLTDIHGTVIKDLLT